MPNQRNRPTTLTQEASRRRWPFSVLLLAALVLAALQPLAFGLIDDRSGFDALMSVLIVAVLLFVFEEREHRWTATLLAAAAVLGLWLSLALGEQEGRWVLVSACLLAASFFAFALYGILRRILARQASSHAIFGAVCGYLLLGIIWSLLYFAVEVASPGSFRVAASAEGTAATEKLSRDHLTYFSFVTLTTVGYGDVTPTTSLARELAWIEALAGQLYLAILVAGLVGFKVSQAMKT